MSLLRFAILPLLVLPGLPNSSTLAWPADSEFTFSGLGDLAGGAYESAAEGVSADGGIVTGVSESEDGSEAFSWNPVSGITALGDIANGPFSSKALAASEDGSVLVGIGTTGSLVSPTVSATRWVSGGNPIPLGSLNPSGFQYSVASDISADGTIVVGSSSSPDGFRAFKWTSGGTMISLGAVLPSPSVGGDKIGLTSSASAISADGTRVVGDSGYAVSTIETIQPPPISIPEIDANGNPVYDQNGNPSFISFLPDPYDVETVIEQGTEAYVWTQGTGMVGLGDLAGGFLGSTANAISDDGSVIVGSGQNGTGSEGVVWTDGVIQSIGDFDGGSDASVLNDVSADGTIAVGQGTDALGTAALIWSADSGIVNLNSFLSEQGVNVGDWRLTSATGISADGKVIVGNGINPSGDTEAWQISIAAGSPEGLQESISVFRGTAALFSAERGRDYQLLESTNLATWTPEGAAMSTANAGGSFTHALPITTEPQSAFYLLGPSTVASEADTSISIFNGTLLGYTSERGYIYQAEYSDDLITWLPFDSPLDSSSDSGPVDRVFIDTSAPPQHTKRFYRIDTVQSGVLTVPFELNVGYFAGMEMPVGIEFQLRIKIGDDPYIDYGPPFSTEGAATDHYYYAPIPFPPLPTLQLVTLPTGDPYSNQNVLGLATGAVVSFTSQPGSTYQVQRSTDGVTFTNLGDSIDSGSDTGSALRMVLDSFDPTSPPANVSYRVVETPPFP